jgi:RimJ/RimL family protein N-acetyltransferase
MVAGVPCEPMSYFRVVKSFPSVLETERLRIKPSDPASAEAVNAAIQESFPELHRWMPWAEHLPSVEETRQHLANAQEHHRSGADCTLGLWLKDSGVFVGASGLHPRADNPAWREIGYWIHSAYTGKGLATEAVRAIARMGFELGLEAVQLKVSEQNVVSIRVAERAGFVREAVIEGHRSRTFLYVLQKRE